MAPPNFPQGMTLYSIGFAALRYPELPPTLPIPLNNQVGVLQRVDPNSQNQIVSQIASQYLDSLLAYQTGDDPQLHDQSSPQYYFSTVLCLLNFLTMNPDVCKRITSNPNLMHGLIEKLLSPNFEADMKACDRPALASGFSVKFEDDFGSLLQFISTMMLHQHYSEMHPKFRDLEPKLKEWKRKYMAGFVGKVADRIVEQFDMAQGMIDMVKGMQKESLCCGVEGCRVKDGLTACGTCKIQRYCGRDHQRRDWKYHKHICNKGLVEPEGEAAAS